MYIGTLCYIAGQVCIETRPSAVAYTVAARAERLQVDTVGAATPLLAHSTDHNNAGQ